MLACMEQLGDDGHERWQTLAISHVVGGLDPDVSADFRRHLVGCPTCKAQVRELRDLAGSLSEVARDEQAMQAIRTQARQDLAEDESDTDQERARPSWWPRAAAAVVVVALVGLVALVLQLRTQQDAALEVADRQETTLDALGTGLPMDTTFTGGGSGVVVSDGQQVAWSLSELPVPRTGQRLAVWLVTGSTARLDRTVSADQAPDGAIAGSTEAGEATELVVTAADLDALLELPEGAPPEVLGDRLVSADLSLFSPGE